MIPFSAYYPLRYTLLKRQKVRKLKLKGSKKLVKIMR